MEVTAGLSEQQRHLLLSGDFLSSRHRKGVYNSVFADQFGEQTYIRKGKAQGGLKGITLNEDQVANWLMSYPLSNDVSRKMDDMFRSEDKKEAPIEKHREEGKKRIQQDENDRDLIRQELKKSEHSLKITTPNLVNIYNGCVASDRVNCHQSVENGTDMMNEFIKKLPEGFYEPIRSRITTMSSMKQSIEINGKQVFDMEKLYAFCGYPF